MNIAPIVHASLSALAFSATTQALADGYLSPWWQPNVITGLPPALYPSLFISGYYAPGFGSVYGLPSYLYRPSYLCRTSAYGASWNYGHVYNNNCYLGSNGFEVHTGSFSYLIGGSHLHWGRRWSINSTDAQIFEQVCRVELGGSVVTGTLEDQNCVVAYEGVQIISPEYEVLLDSKPQ